MFLVSCALGRAFQWPKHREVDSLNLRRHAMRASHSKPGLSIKNSLTQPFVMNWSSLWTLTLKVLLKEVTDHQPEYLWPKTLHIATGQSVWTWPPPVVVLEPRAPPSCVLALECEIYQTQGGCEHHVKGCWVSLGANLHHPFVPQIIWTYPIPLLGHLLTPAFQATFRDLLTRYSYPSTSFRRALCSFLAGGHS